MTLSASYTVNGVSNPAAHAAAYSSTVSLALLSTTGAGTILWQIIACSKSGASLPAITRAGTPNGATASFVLPADPGDGLGRAYLVKCSVADSRTTVVEYAIVGVLNAAGLLPLVPGEENARDATHGWSQTVNQALASTATPVPTTLGTPVANIAALKAVGASDRVDNQSRAVGSPAQVWIFSSGTGAGFASDDLTVVRPTDVLLANNGRWYPASPSAVVPTIAALRLAVAGTQSCIHMQAFTTKGDNGGGIFDYDSTDTTTVDDGGTVVVAGTRRYKRRHGGEINACWFGVNADAVDNHDAIVLAVNAAVAAGGGRVFFPRALSTYKFATRIDLPTGVGFSGVSRRASVLEFTGASGDGIRLSNTLDCAFSNIKIKSGTNGDNAVHLACIDTTHYSDHNTFDDVEFEVTKTSAAGLLISGTTDTGGAGYVYYTKLSGCIFGSTTGATRRNAGIRTSSSGNAGAILTRMSDVHFTGLGTHFDAGANSCTGTRAINTFFDGNSVSKATMAGSPTLTFAEVGGTGDTITRSAGSWITDGFAVGDVIAVTGTANNNITGDVTAVSATVLTLGTTDLVAEVTAAGSVTTVGGIFIKFGPNTNENVFENTRLESSGTDAAVYFDTTCTNNHVGSRTGMPYSSILGAGRDLNFNGTSGFAQVTSNDYNLHPYATSFGQLASLQSMLAQHAGSTASPTASAAIAVKNTVNDGFSYITFDLKHSSAQGLRGFLLVDYVGNLQWHAGPTGTPAQVRWYGGLDNATPYGNLGPAGLRVDKGGAGSDATARIHAVSAAIGEVALAASAKAGQTAKLFEVRDSSDVALMSVDKDGKLVWAVAGNTQTTVGAAGVCSAVPATPTKYLKVVDSDGAVLVVPAFLPS